VGAGTDVKPLPVGLRWLDPLFRKILGAEASVFALGLHLPLGLSVICLAQKAGQDF